VARVDRILRRRQVIEIAAVASEGVVLLVVSLFFLRVPDTDASVFVLALLPLVPALSLRTVFGTSRKKALEMLRSIGPRLKDVEVPMLRPLHIILDNGVLLRAAGVIAIAFVYLGMDGGVIVPTIEQGRRWTKHPLRNRRVVVVAPGQGPVEARRELRALRGVTRLRIIGITLQERPPLDLATDPRGPRWIGIATLSRFRGLGGGPGFLESLDAVVAFVRRLREPSVRHSIPGG
jgi:hypothetical protein